MEHDLQMRKDGKKSRKEIPQDSGLLQMVRVMGNHAVLQRVPVIQREEWTPEDINECVEQIRTKLKKEGFEITKDNVSNAFKSYLKEKKYYTKVEKENIYRNNIEKILLRFFSDNAKETSKGTSKSWIRGIFDYLTGRAYAVGSPDKEEKIKEEKKKEEKKKEEKKKEKKKKEKKKKEKKIKEVEEVKEVKEVKGSAKQSKENNDWEFPEEEERSAIGDTFAYKAYQVETKTEANSAILERKKTGGLASIEEKCYPHFARRHLYGVYYVGEMPPSVFSKRQMNTAIDKIDPNGAHVQMIEVGGEACTVNKGRFFHVGKLTEQEIAQYDL